MKRSIYLFGPKLLEFWSSLDHQIIEKIEWTIKLIKEFERIPSKYLKYLKGTNALYEIRCEWLGKAIRLFCFFDEDKMMVIIHGFIKKSQKTPSNEIRIAEKIKNEYYEQKRQK